MLDLCDFLSEESLIVKRFFENVSDPAAIQSPSVEVIFEHILQLFTKWATGMTSVIIRQDVLNQLRTARHSQHVKPGSSHQPVLHGTIRAVGIYSDGDAAVIRVRQDGYELDITAALHGALMPFLKRFLGEGRRIHFGNIRFSNDCLIPDQICVIDLRRTKDDIDFIRSTCVSTSLQCLDQANPPLALLLRIESPAQYGIIVSDGGSRAIEFRLKPEQTGLKQLLRFGEVVLLYKPWIREDCNVLYLVYGPNTVVFRVPVDLPNESVFSQINQHSTLTQDGLSFRNSAACRFVHGTIERIENSIDRGAWMSMSITLCDSDNRSRHIFAQISDCSYELRKLLATIRPHHYVWFFGLLERAKWLDFTSETTVYSPAVMHSIVSSSIINPLDLNSIADYVTFLCRAVVIKIEANLTNVHEICGCCLLPSGLCSLCQARVEHGVSKELILTMEIDDGSCDGVTVMAVASKFPFWSGSVEKWQEYGQSEKQRLLDDLLGREFLFVLSKADLAQFGGVRGSNGWRVDQCGKPIGDLEREVYRIFEWHLGMDQEKARNEI
jgi:hypothetical protein